MAQFSNFHNRCDKINLVTGRRLRRAGKSRQIKIKGNVSRSQRAIRIFGYFSSQKGLARGPFREALSEMTCGQIASVIHLFNSPFGAAPTLVEAILPSLNSIKVGMLRIP